MGAKRVLREFYLNLRKTYKSSDCTPITTRQLESLIRLSEARAKLELRELVTEEDALDVVDIMKESMLEVMGNDEGFVDFRRATGMSQPKKAREFMKVLHQKAQQKQSAVFSSIELENLAHQMQLRVDNFHEFLEMLNDQNFLLVSTSQSGVYVNNNAPATAQRGQPIPSSIECILSMRLDQEVTLFGAAFIIASSSIFGLCKLILENEKRHSSSK